MNAQPGKLNEDFYDNLPQHVKNSIETAIKQIDAGEYYEHDWVMEDIRHKFDLN